MSPGLRITSPVVVSYHWKRNPSNRLSCATSVSVAPARSLARALVIKPRSLAATTAHRYTPMLEAEVYLP